MELHYSQTGFARRESAVGFTTLWNYTILKRLGGNSGAGKVLLPYGITLFSNTQQKKT